MWSEKFRIGVDLIDEQHKQLFDRVETLLKNLTDGTSGGPASGERAEERKKECVSAVLFLKMYVVKHFADEENYLKSISYSGLAEHRKLHEAFVKAVVELDRRMAASDYSESDVGEFTGTLVTWLIYHIADVDRKYVSKRAEDPAAGSGGDKTVGCVARLLYRIADLEESSVRAAAEHGETFADAVVVETEFDGGVSGFVAIVYPFSFVAKLIDAMMHYVPETIGQLEISSLVELSYLISEAICAGLAESEGARVETKPPSVTKRADLRPDTRTAIDTGIGIIEVDVAMQKK